MCDVAVSVLQQALDYLQVGLCIHCTAASSGAASAAKCMRELDKWLQAVIHRCYKHFGAMKSRHKEAKSAQSSRAVAWLSAMVQRTGVCRLVEGRMHKKGIRDAEA